MKSFRSSSQFRRDYRRMLRRGCDEERITSIIHALRSGTALPPSARSHLLQGEWTGAWECHIAPDWLLIYDLSETELILFRTGTHADLFE